MNPRHLKRLDSSYSLIRKLYKEEDENERYPRLTMLLWLEYCRELPHKTAAHFSNYAGAVHRNKPEEVIEELVKKMDEHDPSVRQLWTEIILPLGLSDDECHQNYKEVLTFVLPGVEENILSPEGAVETTLLNDLKLHCHISVL